MAFGSLRVMNWNACSVEKRKDQLIEFLRSKSVDVCIITETHLNADIEFTIDGYHVVRKDRITGERRGGVVILIRNGISFQQIEVHTSIIESVGIELELANDKLKIYAAYCPRQCYGERADQLTSDLQMLTRSQDKFLVCGDLNARSEKWSDNVENRNGVLLLKDISIDGRYQAKLPKDPTFVKGRKGSFLDICLTNLITDHDDRPVTVSVLCSDHHYPTIWDIRERMRDVASRQEEHQRDENVPQVRLLHPGTGLKTIEDADLGLEDLCQIVEIVIRSNVHKIAAEAHNLLVKSTAIPDDEITDITRNQLATAGLETFSKFQDNVLNNESVTSVLLSMIKNMPKTLSIVLNIVLFLMQYLKCFRPSSEQKTDDTQYRQLKKSLEKCLGKNRAGSSTEAIFTLRQIRQKSKKNSTHFLFVNLKSSYASVNKESLWRFLSKHGCLSKNLIQQVQTVADRMTPDSPIGLKQDDELSRLLMAIATDVVIHEAIQATNINIDDLQIICYEDDVVLIAKNSSDLHEAGTKIKEVAEIIGILMNAENFKYMIKSNKDNKDNKDLPTVSLVDKYQFLGSMFDLGNDPMKEINHRILKGKQCYEQRREILESPARTFEEKLNIHNKIIALVLQGLEPSILSTNQIKAIKDFEYEVLKTINGPVQTKDGKMYYPTYPTLVEKWLKHGIVPLAKLRRLRWAGQVARMPENHPARIALNRVAQDKRFTQWEDRVKADLKEIGFANWNDWQKEAQDPVKWGRVLDKATEYYSKKT